MSTLSSAPGKQVVVAQTELKAGALHLPEVLMQAITHIAPAIGLITSVQAIALNAGRTAPLAFLIAFVLMLMLGVGLVELAKHLPSAGGYYTYVSRTVSARAGFLTTWMYFLYDPVGGLLNFAIMGWILQAVLKAEWNVVFPWWLFMILATALLTFLTYVGVELSGRSIVVLGIFEMVVVLLLTFTGLIHPGSGGVNLGGFNPGNSVSSNGLFLGIVFCIFAFTGFESVAPMAEESANPRRTLPRAIIWSIVIMGVFYTLCTWGILIGWGTNDVKAFGANTDVSGNPVLPLARHLWGWAWIFVLIAMLNSVLAVSIACQNAVTRVYFAMGRTGVLPRALAKVHPRYKTPTNAIWFQTAINLVVGLGLGFLIGPYNEWALLAIVLTLAMILVYSVGNFGVFRFYRREHRDEFNVLRHVVCPLVSTVALLIVGYFSLVPLPSGVLAFAPLIVGVWLIGGIGLMFWLSRSGKEEWLISATREANEGVAETEPAASR